MAPSLSILKLRKLNGVIVRRLKTSNTSRKQERTINLTCLMLGRFSNLTKAYFPRLGLTAPCLKGNPKACVCRHATSVAHTHKAHVSNTSDFSFSGYCYGKSNECMPLSLLNDLNALLLWTVNGVTVFAPHMI